MTAPVRRRRRMQPWEVERAKLKTWQRDRRRRDVPLPGFDYADPDLKASVAKLALILRVEREARRCGCATPYPLP